MHLVYVDESGDHALSPANDEYPVFVMAACVFDSEQYAGHFIPALTRLKLRHWGHEAVVLHEREIRRPTGDFGFLQHPDRRTCFMKDIEQLVAESGANLHAVLWDKRTTPMGDRFENVYGRCLEALVGDVLAPGYTRDELRWIIESRGPKEDRQAAEGLARTNFGGTTHATFVPKARNLAGLQLSDLCARPIGTRYLNPGKPNRAFETVRTRLRPPPDGATCLGGLVRVLENERGR